MDWTSDTIALLRQLWAEGHSTAEIGRRMGTSKNAVVGKAHRLNLKARPNPIKAPVPGKVKVVRVIALPVLASEAEPEPPPPPAHVVIIPATLPTGERIYARARICCWPIGTPKTKAFRFCDHPALVNKPYCDSHTQLAYVKDTRNHRRVNEPTPPSFSADAVGRFA